MQIPTFKSDNGLNRKVFSRFESEVFPFYFDYLEYRSWPKKKTLVRVKDPLYRSAYIQIKFFKPIHPACTLLTNRLWKEHLASQKIVL